LGVKEASKGWTFSTHPIHGASLKPLADLLQQAENRRTPAGQTPRTWFDGKRFDHTLIGEPTEGSVLADEEVFGVVRRWVRARPWPPQRSGVYAVLAVAAVLLLGFGIYKLLIAPAQPTAPAGDPPVFQVAIKVNGQQLESAAITREDN